MGLILKKRQLGNTSIFLSSLGLGTVKFGRNTDVKYPRKFNILSEKQYNYLSSNNNENIDSTISYIDPTTYLDSANFYINSGKYNDAVEPLLSAFIEGYDSITYINYEEFYKTFDEKQLNELSNYLQILKYSDSIDIQASTYLNLALIELKLGNNNLSFTYINEYSKLMPDEIITYIILGNIFFNKTNYIDALLEYQKILWLYPNDIDALFRQAICMYQLEYFSDAKVNFEKILNPGN